MSKQIKVDEEEIALQGVQLLERGERNSYSRSSRAKQRARSPPQSCVFPLVHTCAASKSAFLNLDRPFEGAGTWKLGALSPVYAAKLRAQTLPLAFCIVKHWFAFKDTGDELRIGLSSAPAHSTAKGCMEAAGCCSPSFRLA